MDNQDSRRSSGAPPGSPSGVIDFGPSPPWGVPPSIFEESAERFKPLPSRSDEGQQNAASGHGLAQRNMQSGTGPVSQDHQYNTPLANERRVETAQLKGQQDERAESHGYESRPRDSVYMINASHSSWSGHLPSEAGLGHLPTSQIRSSHPPIHLNSDPGNSEQLRSDVSQPLHPVSSEALQHQQAWRKDLHLTNILRFIKAQLQAGALITIEHMPNEIDHSLLCDFPYCTAPQHRIQPSSYYIMLGFSHAEGSILQYCLSCFEGLWNGDDVMSALPSVHVREKHHSSDDDVSIMALDGAMDDKNVCWTPVNKRTSTPITMSRELYTSTASPTSDEPSTPGTELSSHVECSSPTQDKAERRTLEAKAPIVPVPKAELHGYLSSLHSKALSPRTNTCPEGLQHGRDRASADDISTEVRRAQTRLERMYDERERLVATLKPGGKAIIAHDRVDNREIEYKVSMDLLGVISTDLLAKPLSRKRARGSREQSQLMPRSAMSGTRGKRNARPSNAVTLARQTAALMCTCSRPDDGSLLVGCDNQRCLIGWYHADCLTESMEEEECISGRGPWLCPLCKSTTQPGDGIMPPPRQHEAEALLTPQYATCSDPYSLQDRRESMTALQSSPEDEATEYPARLTQLDGSDESYPLSSPLSSISDLQTLPSGTDLNPVSEQDDVLECSEDLEANDAIGEEVQDPPMGVHRSSPPTSEFHTPGGSFSPQSFHLLSDADWFGLGPKTPSDLDNIASPRGMLSPKPSHHSAATEHSTTSTSADPPNHAEATRMQHLAAFIRPGESLKPAQNAAVDLWRLASQSQLRHEMRVQWNAQLQEHFERCYNRNASQSHSPRSDCGDAQYDEGEECESGIPSPPATRWNMVSSEECTALYEREAELVLLVGMEEEQCRGKDLSEVLAATTMRDDAGRGQ